MKGFTSIEVEHTHYYSGKTAIAPSNVPHIHYYFIMTTIDVGHRHIICGYTGPAIYLINGGHYHEFEGDTTIDGATPHSHGYSGCTSL